MKLIILDRDGVINQDSEHFVKSPQEWHPIPNSLEAIALLNQAGFKIAIATNQSGLARGYFDEKILDKIHDKLTALLAKHGGKIDKIFFCPHGPNSSCNCRKPKPGLLTQALEHFNIPASESYFVGDSIRDVYAAQKAGCKPVLVRTGNGQLTLNKHPELSSEITISDDLMTFAKTLLD